MWQWLRTAVVLWFRGINDRQQLCCVLNLSVGHNIVTPAWYRYDVTAYPVSVIH